MVWTFKKIYLYCIFNSLKISGYQFWNFSLCAPFSLKGFNFWVGHLNADIDFKRNEMAGNELKISKHNIKFNKNFNCSLFLISVYSSYDILKNHHEYLRPTREWRSLNLVKSGGKSPPSSSLFVVPASFRLNSMPNSSPQRTLESSVRIEDS